MISLKIGGFIVAAFIAGAFIASPELRAYAANTVGSADIINNSIQSVDIKDGEVKTADIATGAVAAGRIADGAVGTLKIADDSITADDIKADAVGASEIQGVSKLIFSECFFSSGFVLPGNVYSKSCSIPGVDSNDKAVASLKGNLNCFAITNVFTTPGAVIVYLGNVCNASTSTAGVARLSIVVFDT